jgi:uncharacterized BrkB/YihY/UPF0761 family membrane protein
MKPYRIRILAVVMLMVTCLVVFIICWLVSSSVNSYFLKRGQLIPEITDKVIMNPYWVLAVPVPWIIYLFIARKKEDTLIGAILFMLCVELFTVVMVGLVTLGCMLPWLPKK